MKMNRLLLSLIFLASLSTGCSLNPGSVIPQNPTDPTDPQDPTDTEPIKKGTLYEPYYGYEIRATKEEVTYKDLFNLNNKVEVLIEADKEELDKIENDKRYGHKSEIYHLAKKFTLNLTNGDNVFTWEFENVGIRQKGNTSREEIFKEGKLNPHNHYKISFDETFTDTEMYSSDFITAHGNEEYKDREFLGLSGLDFKWNRNSDITHIKEIYGSYMYKSAGIIVQSVGLSTLKIKVGSEVTDFGLCFMYEQTSKSIIKRSFSENEIYINITNWDEEKSGTYGVNKKKYGDYYKTTYGAGDGYSYNGGGDLTLESIQRNRVGVKTDIYGMVYPTYERKTNTDSNYDDTLFKEMVGTLNNGTYSQIAQKVDMDYLGIEEAVGFYLGNPDSFRYNYNNYMMYFRRTDGKMIVVPIDNDRCFGIGHTWEKGITFSSNENLTPLSNKDVSGNNIRNPLFNKTILSSSSNGCLDTYKQYIELISKSSWVKNDTFTRFFNIAKETYKNETFDINGGEDNISFSSYIAKKLASLNKQEEPPVPPEQEGFDIDSPLDIDFENYYLAGDFNNLYGNYYSDISEASEFMLKPSVSNPGSYEIEFDVKLCEGGFMSENEISFNFRKGIAGDWASGYFGILSTNDHVLIHSNETDDEHFLASIVIKGVSIGDSIKFMIHPTNRSFSYTITKA